MRLLIQGFDDKNFLAVEAAKRLRVVFEAIIREREHQTDKYGKAYEPAAWLGSGDIKPGCQMEQGPGGHELPGWLLVIRKELREAEEAATGHGKRTKTGRNTVRAELLQIAAVCVAALEQHGVEAVVAPDGRVASPEELAARSHGAATTCGVCGNELWRCMTATICQQTRDERREASRSASATRVSQQKVLHDLIEAYNRLPTSAKESAHGYTTFNSRGRDFFNAALIVVKEALK